MFLICKFDVINIIQFINMSKQHLLLPYNKSISLNNRVVMAPMTRSRANNDGNVPIDQLHGLYYEQRASAGLIITEGSQVSKKAVGYINTAGIHTNAQIEGWKKVTKRVHDKGGKIFIQLWHVGRMACRCPGNMSNCPNHIFSCHPSPFIINRYGLRCNTSTVAVYSIFQWPLCSDDYGWRYVWPSVWRNASE